MWVPLRDLKEQAEWSAISPRQPTGSWGGWRGQLLKRCLPHPPAARLPLNIALVCDQSLLRALTFSGPKQSLFSIPFWCCIKYFLPTFLLLLLLFWALSGRESENIQRERCKIFISFLLLKKNCYFSKEGLQQHWLQCWRRTGFDGCANAVLLHSKPSLWTRGSADDCLGIIEDNFRLAYWDCNWPSFSYSVRWWCNIIIMKNSTNTSGSLMCRIIVLTS